LQQKLCQRMRRQYHRETSLVPCVWCFVNCLTNTVNQYVCFRYPTVETHWNHMFSSWKMNWYTFLSSEYMKVPLYKLLLLIHILCLGLFSAFVWHCQLTWLTSCFSRLHYIYIYIYIWKEVSSMYGLQLTLYLSIW
jgi:hypothetical protein